MPDKNTPIDPWIQAAKDYEKDHSNQASGASQPPSQHPQTGSDNGDWKLWQQTPDDASQSDDKLHFLSSPADIASTVVNHLRGAITGPYHLFADAPRTPVEQAIDDPTSYAPNDISRLKPLRKATLAMYRVLGEPIETGISEFKRDHANESDPHQRHADEANDALDMIPIFGPWSSQFANDV